MAVSWVPFHLEATSPGLMRPGDEPARRPFAARILLITRSGQKGDVLSFQKDVINCARMASELCCATRTRSILGSASRHDDEPTG